MLSDYQNYNASIKKLIYYHSPPELQQLNYEVITVPYIQIIGMKTVPICPRISSILGTIAYKCRPPEPEVPGSNPGGPATHNELINVLTTFLEYMMKMINSEFGILLETN